MFSVSLVSVAVLICNIFIECECCSLQESWSLKKRITDVEEQLKVNVFKNDFSLYLHFIFFYNGSSYSKNKAGFFHPGER